MFLCRLRKPVARSMKQNTELLVVSCGGRDYELVHHHRPVVPMLFRQRGTCDDRNIRAGGGHSTPHRLTTAVVETMRASEDNRVLYKHKNKTPPSLRLDPENNRIIYGDSLLQQ